MGRQTENDANEITRERRPGGRGGKRVRGRELQGRGSQVTTCLAWLTWPVRTSEEASVAGTEEVQRIKSRRVGPGGNGGRGGRGYMVGTLLELLLSVRAVLSLMGCPTHLTVRAGGTRTYWGEAGDAANQPAAHRMAPR